MLGQIVSFLSKWLWLTITVLYTKIQIKFQLMLGQTVSFMSKWLWLQSSICRSKLATSHLGYEHKCASLVSATYLQFDKKFVQWVKNMKKGGGGLDEGPCAIHLLPHERWNPLSWLVLECIYCSWVCDSWGEQVPYTDCSTVEAVFMGIRMERLDM